MFKSNWQKEDGLVKLSVLCMINTILALSFGLVHVTQELRHSYRYLYTQTQKFFGVCKMLYFNLDAPNHTEYIICAQLRTQLSTKGRKLQQALLSAFEFS